MNAPYTINSRGYDGKLKRSWTCELIESAETLFVFEGMFTESVRHPQLGLVSKGTISIEYFWADKWFNVFTFLGPDRTFRNFYCNVTMPPQFGPSVVNYVDLDLDVLVTEDGQISLLDEDEFAANSIRFRYPPQVISNAEQAVLELKRLIRSREFPFDLLDNLEQNG